MKQHEVAKPPRPDGEEMVQKLPRSTVNHPSEMNTTQALIVTMVATYFSWVCHRPAQCPRWM
jgi:hypothetical protein